MSPAPFSGRGIQCAVIVLEPLLVVRDAAPFGVIKDYIMVHCPAPTAGCHFSMLTVVVLQSFDATSNATSNRVLYPIEYSAQHTWKNGRFSIVIIDSVETVDDSMIPF